MTTKTEGVAQGGPNGSLLWFPEREVQPRIQFRIVSEVVDGWRDLVVNDAHDPGDRLDHPGRSEAVSRHRFGGADIRGEGVFAEDVDDRLDFRTITERGRRPMGIDIINVLRFHPRIPYRCRHDVLGPKTF